jgi:hypothetical protein
LCPCIILQAFPLRGMWPTGRMRWIFYVATLAASRAYSFSEMRKIKKSFLPGDSEFPASRNTILSSFHIPIFALTSCSSLFFVPFAPSSNRRIWEKACAPGTVPRLKTSGTLSGAVVMAFSGTVQASLHLFLFPNSSKSSSAKAQCPGPAVCLKRAYRGYIRQHAHLIKFQ